MRKIILLSISVVVLLTGCYRTVESSNGVAVVNAFNGDVFFPETGEFVSYPAKENWRRGYDLYEISISNDLITQSGFKIQTSVRIDHDIVLYTVTISPTDAHISEVLESESTNYYIPERSDIVEEIIDDLVNGLSTSSLRSPDIITAANLPNGGIFKIRRVCFSN